MHGRFELLEYTYQEYILSRRNQLFLGVDLCLCIHALEMMRDTNASKEASTIQGVCMPAVNSGWVRLLSGNPKDMHTRSRAAAGQGFRDLDELWMSDTTHRRCL